jgi:general secretion pathway protein A
MYTAFYGLREKPFALSPDPRFLFLAASHREALAHVLYGVEQGEGFIAVTGEVGTGKTTLCRTLLERLGRDTEVAFVFNPKLSGEDLLRAINREFGLPTEGRTRAQLSDQLNEFLLEQKRGGRRVLLIVDEAQNLAPETLEEIRLLSNLETSTSKLIQILLFGQPELDDKLDSNELRQLRQRISVRWSLGSLSSAETRDYVRHRLRIAAEQDPDIFSSRALSEVHRRARGIPRLVNLLCDRALLAGYAAGEKHIGPDLVGLAAREILGARRRVLRRRPWLRRTTVAGVALALLGSGVMAWQQWTRVEPRAASREMPSVSTPPVGAAAARSLDAEPATPSIVGPPPEAEAKDAG